MILTKSILFISIFYILLLKFSVLAIEDEYQIQLKQEELQNNDDTSLFREVEDTIDEDSDEDAYRMLKSLQEVSEEDEVEEYENTNHDKEQDEIHSDDDDESYNDDDEEEEEDDDELSTEFPEFQNEATTEFFETLPKQPIDSLDSKINSGQDTIEEEELDEEIDELEPDQEEEEEENINKEIEIKEKEQKDQVQANHNLPNSPSFDNSIPWQRPDSARFYQDIRVKETKPKQETEHSFKFWYFFLLSVVLTLLYRSFTHRSSGMIDLSTATSSNSTWNRDEKDYLPLHSGSNKRNSYYKNEIKSS